MKPILLILALLFSSADACPVRAGYFANGQYRDTSGLTPLCTSEYKSIAASSASPTEYAELYAAPSTAAGQARVLSAFKALTSHGWVDTGSPVSNKALRNDYHAYEKGSRQIVILVSKQGDRLVVVVIGDR